MSKPRQVLPVECGPFVFGVSLDAVAKALCPRLSGVKSDLVDLLYSIEWLKDRVKRADAVVEQKQAIPKHLRKVTQKFVPVLTGRVIDVGELGDGNWLGSVHCMSSGARVIEVDELDDALDARDTEKQILAMKLAEFNDLCQGALTRGDSNIFFQLGEIIKALEKRPLAFLVFQAWMLGLGESPLAVIRKQVNDWLQEENRNLEIIHPGHEKTIKDALDAIGLAYPVGKNKKSSN